MPTWFQQQLGFAESGRYEDVQDAFRLEHGKLCLTKSRSNTCAASEWAVGSFSAPSLLELRRSSNSSPPAGGPSLSLEYGDVSALLCDPNNRFATFQVASQFNCLEFVGPHVTPENGISGYQFDRTQGPACSIACGPATVVRNYLIPVDATKPEVRGQRSHAQLNNADHLLARLGVPLEQLHVQNGYLMAKDAGLRAANAAIAAGVRDELTGLVKVGAHEDVQVTSTQFGSNLVNEPDQIVTQVFTSACPVSYSGNAVELWQPLAQLVLDASFEATLRAAAQNAARHAGSAGAARVFLTPIGGGVFGNDMRWVARAIKTAMERCRHLNLDVRIVEFRPPAHAALLELVRSFGDAATRRGASS